MTVAEQATPNHRHLPTWRKAAYAAIQFGNGGIDVVVAVFLLKFYTDYAGLAPDKAGLALLVGKAFDAFTDPLMGYISDRTQTRWGRRRPWFVVGVIPLTVSLFAMFSPDPAWSQTHLFIWLAATNSLFYLGSTVLDVPHAALGSEMTSDHRDRLALMGWRQAMNTVGLLAGATVPALYIARREHAAESLAAARQVYEGVAMRPERAAALDAHGDVALFLGFLLLCMVIVTFLGTRETARVRKVQQTIFGDFRDALRNKPFQLFIAIFMLEQIGSAFTTTLALYAFNDWWGLDVSHNKFLLGTYLASGFVSIPIWVRIGRHREKSQMFLCGAILATLALCLMLLVGRIGWWWGYAMLALAGSGFGARVVMALSIFGDLIDYDEYETGERRDGAYFGVWMLLRKLARALSFWLVGLGLGYFGYVEGGVEQTPRAVYGIMLMFSPVSAAFILGSSALFLWWPLNRHQHETMVAEILRRRDAADATA